MPGRHKPRRKPRAPKATERTLRIDTLGAGGDGLAEGVAVPYALPGETVRAAVTGRHAQLKEIVSAIPAREVPVCPHFGPDGGRCGGCHLQHLGLEGSRQFKLDHLRETIARTGMDVPGIDLIAAPPKSRRRVRLGAERRGSAWRFGHRAYRSDRLVPMTECHVLHPTLFDAAKETTDALPTLVPSVVRQLEIVMTLTDTGIDLTIMGVEETNLDLSMREGWADLAGRIDLARLTVGGSPLSMRRVPQVRFGGVPMPVPPGVFLQATIETERAMQQRVLDAAAPYERVADLFCGLGTFALPLAAAGHQVLAADADPEAMAALGQTARSSALHIETVRRNLFERPLSATDLGSVDVVVIDPPRAGAQTQCLELATAQPPRVVMVSCHPGTLARDMRILADARYRLTSLTLVDQFLWSPHIESIAILDRTF